MQRQGITDLHFYSVYRTWHDACSGFGGRLLAETLGTDVLRIAVDGVWECGLCVLSGSCNPG